MTEAGDFILYTVIALYLFFSLLYTCDFVSDRKRHTSFVHQVYCLPQVILLLAFTGVFFLVAVYQIKVGDKQSGHWDWTGEYKNEKETRYFHSLGLKDGDRAIKLLYPLLLLLPCFIPLFLFLL